MSLSPDIGRTITAKLREQLKHSVSHCSLAGLHWENPLERENLFELVQTMERYIVDTNSNWRAESQRRENKNVAFILGQTVTAEDDNLRALLFSPKVDLCPSNLFHLGLVEISGRPLVGIDRIDEYFRLTFSQEMLDQESKPRVKRTEPEFQLRQQMEAHATMAEKEALLQILGVTDIAELPRRASLSKSESELSAFIATESPRCLRDWWRSVEVARRCYALLLIQLRRMRTEFARPDYRNVFGDVRLVHNALFLRSGILSNDADVKRMASFTGLRELRCVRRAANSSPPSPL